MLKRHFTVLGVLVGLFLSAMLSAQTLEVIYNGNQVPNGAPAAADIGTDWGSVSTGAHCEHVFRIKNTGNQDLNVQINLKPVVGDGFLIVWDRPFTLGPGNQTHIVVDFIPGGIGTYRTIFELQTNDPANGTYSVELTGYGDSIAPAEMEITHNNFIVNSRNNLSAGSVANGVFFPNVPLGSHEDHDFTITNKGTQDLILTCEPMITTDYEINGGTPADPNFSIVSMTGTNVIPAGASINFTVRYEPSGTGYQQGVFLLFSNTKERPYEYYI